MSFKYACFISYRRHERTKAYVHRLAGALKQELDMLLVGEHNQVFRDNDFLRYGDDIDEAIATAICQSVCLLIVYVPNTYQSDYPYCAREYAAMCELEAHRLQNLEPVLRPDIGPILTLPFRGTPNTLPAELANRRPYDFGAYRDLSNAADLQDLPATIAQDIAHWCNLFSNNATLPSEGGCNNFQLPAEDSQLASKIVEQQRNTGFHFPNRSG